MKEKQMSLQIIDYHEFVDYYLVTVKDRSGNYYTGHLIIDKHFNEDENEE